MTFECVSCFIAVKRGAQLSLKIFLFFILLMYNIYIVYINKIIWRTNIYVIDSQVVRMRMSFDNDNDPTYIMILHYTLMCILIMQNMILKYVIENLDCTRSHVIYPKASCFEMVMPLFTHLVLVVNYEELIVNTKLITIIASLIVTQVRTITK